MQLNLSLVKSPAFGRALFCLVVCVGLRASAQAPAPASPARSKNVAAEVYPVDVAFEHFYNMDYDRSVQEFDKILDRHPDDPFAVNHLLTTVLLRELYRMGAMSTGEYANDSFIGQAHRPANPKVKEQIRRLVERAENLEDTQIKVNGNDAKALYARGVTRAQFALYTALVERAWISALRNAVGARHDHGRFLELDPNYVEAKLLVATHNYVMGSLPWSVKVAGTMVGLSGTKEKGFEYLHEVATSSGENSIDAKLVLSLFLRRDHPFYHVPP